MKKFYILPVDPMGTPVATDAQGKVIEGKKLDPFDHAIYIHVFLYRDSTDEEFIICGKEAHAYLSELAEDKVNLAWYSEYSIGLGTCGLNKADCLALKKALIKSGYQEGKKLHSVCSISYGPGEGLAWETMNKIVTNSSFHIAKIE